MSLPTVTLVYPNCWPVIAKLPHCGLPLPDCRGRLLRWSTPILGLSLPNCHIAACHCQIATLRPVTAKLPRPIVKSYLAELQNCSMSLADCQIGITPMTRQIKNCHITNCQFSNYHIVNYYCQNLPASRWILGMNRSYDKHWLVNWFLLGASDVSSLVSKSIHRWQVWTHQPILAMFFGLVNEQDI